MLSNSRALPKVWVDHMRQRDHSHSFVFTDIKEHKRKGIAEPLRVNATSARFLNLISMRVTPAMQQPLEHMQDGTLVAYDSSASTVH